MFSGLKNFILSFYYSSRLVKINERYFKNNIKKKDKKIFLVEFNAFHNFHVASSIFSNFFKKEYNCNIHAFFNNCLLSSSLKFSIFNELKWKIGNLFSLKTFKIYKSFGVDKIFKPQISSEILKKANLVYNKNFLKIRSKQDILNFKIKGIIVGDLLYDTFLKSRIIPTIDFKSKDFSNFFREFIILFFYWDSILKKELICGVATSHSVYSYALILRLANKKKIDSFVISTNYISKFNPKSFGGTIIGDFLNFKKDFNRLKKIDKHNAILKSSKILKKKFSGVSGTNFSTEYMDRSSFSKLDKHNKFLNKSKRFKVLICAHDFFDAVHFYGNSFFEDFYDWLYFLGKFSKKTNYDWYLKTHPTYGGKYVTYQKFTKIFVDQIVKKFSNIKQLPNNISHKQLIDEGIGAVLTVYGSVANEYPFFGIPVLNAGKRNSFCSYGFSKTPKTKKEYLYNLKNLEKLKVNKNAKKEIYEYYYMRHLSIDNNWLFKNNHLMLKEIGGIHKLTNYHFYKYWIKYCNKKIINRAENKISKFIRSNKQILSIHD